MRRAKKSYLLAITLVIAGLMITSATTIAINSDTNKEISIKVQQLEKQKQTMTMPLTGTSTPKSPLNVRGDPAFGGAGDQLHPAVGRNLQGKHLASYYDATTEEVIWTYSLDDGATYDPGVYYGVGGDYPSIELWNDGQQFVGTFVTDYQDASGAAMYLLTVTDPADYTNGHAMVYWDWSSYGWHDMLDSEIAADNSQLPWEYGMISMVFSTTYSSPEIINGPFISYQTSEAGQATISWYTGLDGCAHTDAEIDHINYKTYAVYDWLNPDTNQWEIIVRQDFFNNWNAEGNLIEVTADTGNLTFPTVAAYNGKLVIVAQSNEAGNNDIVCLYGSMANLQSTVIAGTAAEELYPEVRHVQDEKFEMTYVSEGKLFKSTSLDAGATWSAPEEVETGVTAEYKGTDLSDFAVKSMYETSNGADLDIAITTIGIGPVAPVLEVAINTGFGLGAKATVTNAGNAPATNVTTNMTVVGGILGLINKEKLGNIPSLAVDGTGTFGSGMLIGLGTFTITVKVSCDEGSSAQATKDGTQLAIFTIVK